MAECHELFVLPMRIVEKRAKTLSAPVEVTDLSLADLGVEALDRILRQYGQHSAGWLVEWGNFINSNLDGRAPWAVVVFPREYRLAGHVTHHRGEIFMPFTAASVPYRNQEEVPPGYVPPLGELAVMRKPDLQALSSCSLLFTELWQALAPQPHNRHWLCIPHELPTPWVKKNERHDDDVYRAARNRKSAEIC